MNKFQSIIFCFLTVLLVACGEDRTLEYQEKTSHNIWMYEQMKDKYLWSDKMKEQSWKDYFATPTEYFTKLVAYGTNDVGSYILVDSLPSKDPHARNHFNHVNTYGMNFVTGTDPTQLTSKTFARVMTVYANSPASEAGLKRNDFIETFDGYKISSKNYANLEKGESRTLVVRTIGTDSLTGDTIWVGSRTVTLPASRYVEDKPFPVYDAFTSHGETVGYLMCNRLTETAVETNGSTLDYKAQMDEAMTMLKSANVSHIILDLRLCNFGTLEMARRLASYIIPVGKLNDTFVKTVWNSNHTANNQTILYDSSLADKSLDLDDVTIITSNVTQGAAEWVIRALKCALGEENVMVIGIATNGQITMTEHIGDYNDMIHIYPSVAYIVDANGNDSSSDTSITPDYVVNEEEETFLYDYGDIRECLLSAALYYLFDYEEETTSQTDK